MADPTLTSLNVLLVPDAFPWILGTWAKQIASIGKRHRYYYFSTSLYSHHQAEWEALIRQMDVIHVLTQHGYSELPLPEDKARVGTIHHVVDWDELSPITRADALCYVADEWKIYLLEHGTPAERLFEIRNGVDAGVFSPQLGTLEARRQLGLPDDAYLVGFFAKASSDDGGRKGVDVLVRTLDLLREGGCKVRLLITGPGWSGVVRALQATGIPVTHFPFLAPEQMPVAYNALDAYLITSRVEGGPVPLLEAMASGVPVVTTQVGIVPQIVNHGTNGLIIPKDSPAAAARALMMLMGDRALAAEIGRCARSTILDGWQWRQTLRDIDDLYDLAINQHAKGGAPVQSSSSAAQNTRLPAPDLAQLDPANQREAILREDQLLWRRHVQQPVQAGSGRAGQPMAIGVGRRNGRHALYIPDGASLKHDVINWVMSMRSPVDGGFDFGLSEGLAPDLLSQCFAVLCLELFDALPAIPATDRARWRAQIAASYQGETGYFVEPQMSPGDLPARGHNWQYVTWQSTMFARSALEALGDRSAYPAAFLEDLKSPDRIVSWLEERNWRNPWLESNNIMFAALFLLQEADALHGDANGAILEAMFRWLDDHQNPVTGYWDLGRGSSLLNAMAGAFHLYFLYLITGRRVQYPERILESTLSLQQPDGLFDPRGGGGACLDLDAVDILVKFSHLTDYRSEDVRTALGRAFAGILGNQNADGGFCEARRRAIWQKSRKRRLAEFTGLDRLLNRPWQGRPVEHISISGIKQLRHQVDASDLWATWFRSLALALVSTRYPGEFIQGVNWRFKTTPTLGWHDMRPIVSTAEARTG